VTEKIPGAKTSDDGYFAFTGATFKVGHGYRLRIRVTTWQTWNGRQIEKAGIVPDIPVEFTPQFAGCQQGRRMDESIKIADS
jgi:C-terminal processing protease CtpA/Prc